MHCVALGIRDMRPKEVTLSLTEQQLCRCQSSFRIPLQSGSFLYLQGGNTKNCALPDVGWYGISVQAYQVGERGA